MDQKTIDELSALRVDIERIKNRINALEAKGKDEFAPGWYICHDDDEDDCRFIYLRDGDDKILNGMKDNWAKVEPVTAETIARFLPKPATRYDWSKAPEWANWAAINSDRTPAWLEEMPTITNTRWRHRGMLERIDNECVLDGAVHWTSSLEERP